MNPRQQMVSALLEAATAINRGEDTSPILRFMVERLKGIEPQGAVVPGAPEVVKPVKRATTARASLATLPGLLEAESMSGSSMVLSGAPDGAEELETTIADPERAKLLAEKTAVHEVFHYWVKATGKDAARTKLSPERVVLIRSRLKTFSVKDLKLAIAGCVSSPFHSGGNSEGKVFNELDLIFRNTTKVEYFRDMAGAVSFEETEPRPIATVSTDDVEWERETVRLDAVALSLLQQKRMTEYAAQVRANRERLAGRKP
jgi:hypothetical protein